MANPTQQELYKEYIENNLSPQEICSRFGISQTQFYRLCKKYHIKKPKITQDKLIQQQIIQEYIDGQSSIQLCKKYNVSKKWILDLLHKNNIDIKKIKDYSKFLNVITKDSLLALYVDKELSLSSIARKYKTDHHTIARWLFQYGINKRKQVRHKCNDGFFRTQSRDMAYILGFILADGCVRKGRILSFGVNNKDESILATIKNVMRYTGPIRHWSKLSQTNMVLTYATLTIHSKELVSDLFNFDIEHRKTGHETFPEALRPELYGDFLRGYFDGDGSVKKDGGAANFCSASPVLLNSINHKILNGKGKLRVHIGRQTGMPYYTLDITSKHMASLYDIMYKDGYSDKLCLERKKQRFRINNE